MDHMLQIVDFQKLCKTLAKPQPAGSVLHFRLQTKDSVFAEKTVGGDRWTVIVRGLTIDHTVDGIVTVCSAPSTHFEPSSFYHLQPCIGTFKFPCGARFCFAFHLFQTLNFHTS